jgi:hypothetical protein
MREIVCAVLQNEFENYISFRYLNLEHLRCYVCDGQLTLEPRG